MGKLLPAAAPSPPELIQPAAGSGAEFDAPSGAFPEIVGFELLGWAGRGGMGEVWKALQLAEQRIVAVKILHPPFGSPERRALTEERFKREIAVAAQFDHPALTRVWGSGTTKAGQSYVVMEWIEGLPLDTYLSSTPLPPASRIELGMAIARAVQQLHERGYIHRDLKPDNILITAEATPKILDFGLARSLDPTEFGPTVSQAGDVMGTPCFMSPEQAAGESGRVGTRSDVWSLGIILFHLLSGKWPYPSGLSSADTLRKILTEDPPRLRTLVPGLAKDLEAIVLRCLSRDPARRYDSAGALADDLARWQRGEPVAAQPPTVGYLLGNALRRHRVMTAAVAGVVAASFAAVFWHQQVQSETNQRLQQALAEATDLRNYLLFDLRWNLDSTGREDVLEAAAIRAEKFQASYAGKSRPAGPAFDSRRFQALAANLNGQSLAFRGNLLGALDSCLKEHSLNLVLAAAYPGDPQFRVNTVSSGIGAAGLLLRLERPTEVRPLLEPILQQLADSASSMVATADALLGDRLQLLILLSRSDRETALAAHPVSSRLHRSVASVIPADAKSDRPLSAYPPPLAEALSLLPQYENSADASVLLVCAVRSEAAEWALAEGNGGLAGNLLGDVFGRLDRSWAAKPGDPALLAATVLCQRNLARAAILTGDLDAAWKEIGNAGFNLEALRKDGYFDHGMWKERAVARTAQDLAEALLAKNRRESANHALHLSARMIQVNTHRPVALKLPMADFARQNSLTGRLRNASGDSAGAALSFRRGFDELQKCSAADPDNPVWLLDLVDTGIRLERILVAKPRADLAYTAAQVGAVISAALERAANHPALTPALRDRMTELVKARP